MSSLMAVEESQLQVGIEKDSYAEQTVDDIVRRESVHELAADKLLCWQTAEGQAFGYNTDDQRLLNFMPVLDRLYVCIVDGDGMPLARTTVHWANRPGLKLTKLGRQLLTACQYFGAEEEDGRNWQQAYSHHRFHPVVEVMLGAVMRWWEPICQWGALEDEVIEGQAAGAVEALQAMTDHIRRACRSRAFTNLIGDHEKKANDNFDSGCGYVTAMFERHSRLLILRIDLYFRPDAKGWGYSRAADRAVVNYLRALRDGKIVPGYLGFIIKRENGISRGVHFHLMVFLDGNEHRSAWYITQSMGEAWMKRVGPAKGSFFNCYGRKDRYRYNGLGLVHVSDLEKLIGIRIALWYMSKQDSELKVDDTKKKNFWRSQMPNEPDGRGAKRKDPDSMRVVKRVLSGMRSKYPPGMDLKDPIPPQWRRGCNQAVGMAMATGSSAPAGPS